MVTYAGEAETVAASLIKQTLRAEWYEQADINFLSYKDSLTVPRPILILPCTASKLTVINKIKIAASFVINYPNIDKLSVQFTIAWIRLMIWS